MKKLFSLLTVFVTITVVAQKQTTEKQQKFVLVVHGGAGTILKQNMTPEKEKAYTAGLQSALLAGYKILQSGGSALDAVEIAVKILEDNPLFNAGRGAVFTSEGKNELDAAIMDGKSLKAGSVASVTTIKHPVSAARAVMEKSPHVMMIGQGAELFANQRGLEMVDPKYFFTEERWSSLERIRKEDSLKQKTDTSNAISEIRNNADAKFGTVGAVALDMQGNLAAATSTGGMTNKKFGRVGDAPIIGAGTYANNATCAVSCTGWGEFFIRLVVAKTVCDLMEYKNFSVTKAADEIIMKKVPQLGGDGGLIAVDKHGNLTMPFNTVGMYRGYIRPDGKPVVKIYKE